MTERATAGADAGVWTLPNLLSAIRLAGVPVFLWLVLGPEEDGWALALLVVSGITDWLDGRLAREYGVSSRLGQFLDPLADKVLVLGAFFLIPFLEPIGTGLTAPAGAWLPWLAIGAIAARDVAVTVLRTVYERQGRSLATSTAAKWKTAWQLTFLITAFVFLAGRHLEAMGGALGALGQFLSAALVSPAALVFLVVTAAVTVYTGVLYFRSPTPT
ncbi:MAG: CDP-diacylglycerol--glycerol-3-phosphate 3-phosphatidyltransferase [Nocardioides sp.]|nr:CDP-diacylglycerol--glycerol-3-phosphate 3-phosphatidyltransferase [Nocardioides sp.]